LADRPERHEAVLVTLCRPAWKRKKRRRTKVFLGSAENLTVTVLGQLVLASALRTMALPGRGEKEASANYILALAA
jgi:hypothetical protein